MEVCGTANWKQSSHAYQLVREWWEKVVRICAYSHWLKEVTSSLARNSNLSSGRTAGLVVLGRRNQLVESAGEVGAAARPQQSRRV